jgi:uncharacterized iron-regulated protein
MVKLRTLSFIQLGVLVAVALATQLALARSQIWTSEGLPSDFSSLSESLKTHRVIIMGESHGLKSHQNEHIQVLNELRKQGRKVHVGLEFFYYPSQAAVDKYRLGQISEADFLKVVDWGGISYDFYREQAIFPQYGIGERTWALNAPRSLTAQISKLGLAHLPAELSELLPPYFSLGRDSYRDRFLNIMKEHVKDPQLLQNYFEAQSTWDDTMAWRIQSFQEQYPEAVMLVVVGEFHVQFGGGLPDRLKKRGVEGVLVISQVNTLEMSDAEIRDQVQPDAEYGPRADWIWTAPDVD